jgi:hypothetical protein
MAVVLVNIMCCAERLPSSPFSYDAKLKDAAPHLICITIAVEQLERGTLRCNRRSHHINALIAIVSRTNGRIRESHKLHGFKVVQAVIDKEVRPRGEARRIRAWIGGHNALVGIDLATDVSLIIHRPLLCWCTIARPENDWVEIGGVGCKEIKAPRLTRR